MTHCPDHCQSQLEKGLMCPPVYFLLASIQLIRLKSHINFWHTKDSAKHHFYLRISHSFDPKKDLFAKQILELNRFLCWPKSFATFCQIISCYSFWFWMLLFYLLLGSTVVFIFCIKCSTQCQFVIFFSAKSSILLRVGLGSLKLWVQFSNSE